jgi:hypothetical protein
MLPNSELRRGSRVRQQRRRTDAFGRWIEGRGGTEAAEIRQAIEQVRLAIEQYGESRFQPVDDPEAKPVPSRLGVRKE